MPKLKESPDVIANKRFRAACERQKVMLDMTDEEVSRKAYVNRNTFSRHKCGDIAKADIKLLRRYARILHLTDRDICETIGVTYHGSTPKDGKVS